MTGVSNDRAGIFNYTKKRDIRKWLEREIRSEGYDPFNPKPGQEALMPVTAEDITLVTSVQNPNGHRAVVVGSKTKLWRYYGLDDPLYVAEDYVEADYYSEDASQWQEIGSGFSENGKRWEALNINGYLVLNNGVDLPMTYRERDSEVTPIYELRDQGIASVGSIAEHNGILICLDIRQIKDVPETLRGAVDASVGISSVKLALHRADGYLYGQYPDRAAMPPYWKVNDASYPDMPTVEDFINAITPGGGAEDPDQFATGVAGNILTFTHAMNIETGEPEPWNPVGTTICFWDYTNGTFIWRKITAIEHISYQYPSDPTKWEILGLMKVTIDGDPLLLEYPGHHLFYGPYFNGETISDGNGGAGNILTLPRALAGANTGIGMKVIVWDGEDWVQRTTTAKIDDTHFTVDGAAVLAATDQKWYWDFHTNSNANPLPSTSPDGIRLSIVEPSIETLFPDLAWALNEELVTGLHLMFDSGEAITISGIYENDGSHYFKTDETIVVPSGPVTIENYAAYQPLDDSLIDHFQWRMLWSMPDEPRRFGATVTGTITPTSNIVKLDAPTKSFAVGQEVKVVNISETGMGNVTGTIIYLTPTELFLGESVITNAGQTVVDQVTAARNARNLAKSVLDSAESALEVAKQALADATAALDDDPTNADLIQAKADAAAAVATLELKVSTAQTALEEAETALTEAEKMLEPVPVSVQGADSASSIVAFEDLIDDGSAILRGLTLRNFFIIYKETCMFIARYTGTVDQPFVFEKVPIPMSAALKFKHTLVDVGGLFHFFATNNGFYRFDLTNRVPMEIPELMACKELFFTQAVAEDEPFAANNSATREVFVCIPNSTQTDATIRYDYLQGTVSTSSMMMTAAATVPKPTDPSNRTLPDLWFVMGGNAGELRRYGFVDGPEVVSGAIKATVNNGVATATAAIFTEDHVGRSLRFSGGMVFAITGYISPTQVNVLLWKPIALGQTFRIINAIWHRGGEAYDSIMESGLEAFGAPQSEKMLNEYVLILASKSVGTTIGVTFLTGVNPSEITDEFEAEIDLPLTSNLIPTAIQSNYLGDRITVSGVNNPIEFGSRLLKIEGVASSNFNRHP